MSGPHDHHMRMAPLDQFEPNYGVYDSQFSGLQRSSGPSTPYEGFGFWYRPEAQENMYNPDAQRFDQSRPMQPPAMEVQLALKHKRTRSGCFTCRHRRVKCDETKPICDRCRKGNRQCEFPSKTSTSKKAKTESTSPTLEKKQNVDSSMPNTIKEESEDEISGLEDDDASPNARQTLMDSEQIPSESSSPVNLYENAKERKKEPAPIPESWQNLTPDIQMYLQFQRDSMTHYHYLFKVDPEDFVHKELINLAIQFKPLLLAVVAFAAYHHTIRLPDDEADFHMFWKYYCDSIIALRRFLESNRTRDDLVALTVLQLATFEECMGDWNNLVSHHKAAHGILTSRYTPQSIMDTDRSRKMFDWYIRLDVIAGLMAVQDAKLDRSWLVYAYEWHEQQSTQTDQDQLRKKQEFFVKAIELVAHDTAHLFARANEALIALENGQGQNFSMDNIMSEVTHLSERLDMLRCRIQELNDPSLAGVDQTISLRGEETVFASDVPLFRGALWPLNFVWIDWYGVLILLKHSLLATFQKSMMVIDSQSLPPSRLEHLQQQALSIVPELNRYSKIQCEIYNALSNSTTAPAGVTLVCYASLGLSTVFLPRAPPEENSKYTLWARQKLANIERQGYIWPPHFRKEMANLWGDPEIEDWWLPNGEGKTPILEDIRKVVVDRTRTAQQKEKHGQTSNRDLREIKGLFEMMEISRRGSVDALAMSGKLDRLYASSPTDIANALNLVSSPSSSAGSVTGATSPQAPFPEPSESNRKTKARKRSRGSISGGITASPVTMSRPGPSSQIPNAREDQS